MYTLFPHSNSPDMSSDMETSPIARPLKDQVKNVPKPTMYNILLMVLEENKTAKGLSLAVIFYHISIFSLYIKNHKKIIVSFY